MNIMNEIGIGNELSRIIRHQRWETLVFMNYHVYGDLVYEFYSPLIVPLDDNGNIVGFLILDLKVMIIKLNQRS